MIAVVETEEFLADVKDVLSEDERDDLILYLALHPEAGDLIPGLDLSTRQRAALTRQLRVLKSDWKVKN